MKQQILYFEYLEFKNKNPVLQSLANSTAPKTYWKCLATVGTCIHNLLCLHVHKIVLWQRCNPAMLEFQILLVANIVYGHTFVYFKGILAKQTKGLASSGIL